MHKSIWWDGVSRPGFPTLKGNAKTEVLIIGGGITGVLTAYMLHKQGVPYILVEKDRIFGGVSGNTTAKITAQHSLIYHKLIKSGSEVAEKYLHANTLALNEYKKLCPSAECDFENRDNFVYTDDPRLLEKEISALSKIGANARFTKDIPLPVTPAGAVCFENQAQFHPLKFFLPLAARLNIYENTHVTETADGVAHTQYGEIKAKTIIVATHFPFINKHGSYFLKLYQHRSYVIALKNAPTLTGMYVDNDLKGLSFRSHNGMLLLGGGGHRTGKSGGNFLELRKFAKDNYRGADIVCQWAAQDCESLDGIPYIGEYSSRTNGLLVASGFNKWGMTSAMVAAMLLCDKVQGRQNDFADIFSPSRSIIKPQLIINGLESTVGLLAPRAKRCPHLRCALKWNGAEHSWDCPCHGSRFTADGKVLDGPANGDIESFKK